MNRQQTPYPTPIQQHCAPPSKRVAPHHIGPTGQRAILLNAIGILPLPLLVAAQAQTQGEIAQDDVSSRNDLSFISRMYSAQIPNQAFPQNQLVPALVRELKHNTIPADDYFINHLFPAKLMPHGMQDEAIMAELSKEHDGKPSIWNEEEQCFRDTLYSLKEEQLANWLNNVGNTLGDAFGHSPLRLWSHISCDTPPVGASAYISRKPDLILLDKDYHNVLSNPNEKVDWAFIRAIAEVTRSKSVSQWVIDTINAKTYLMFLCQYNRRFVVALSFTGVKDQSFRLTVTDREGEVQWTTGLIGARSKEHSTLFLRVLVVLMFGTSANIGLDPNIEIDRNGKCVAFTVEKKRFTVVDLIYSLDSVVGRGTRVWTVMHGGVKYVLKDCWIQHERVDSEIIMLKKMKMGEKLNGRVPALVCGGDVQIDNITDSTERYRSGMPGWSKMGQRVHRQLVCTPIGEPLSDYRSKQA